MAWYDRLLGTMGLTRKSFKLEEKPTRIAHGASWSNAYGNKPAYSQLGSLAVFAKHPYVFAALSRLSQDLAATPIKLIKGKGKNAVVITEHPVIDLFEQPSTEQDKFSFLEQIIIDLTACGNCYILLLGLNDQPDSIVRLHPEQIEILTDNLGIKAYRYSAEGEFVDYPPDRIVHGKNASWATGIQGLYGVGCIQPIAEEVMADLNVNRLVSQSSAKGRPDVILSPANDLDVWDSETRRQILEQYNGLAESGGALVVSGMVNVTFTQLSPRDVEYQAARQYSKSAITAALGVPASVLGDDAANFATSRQQAISYWTTLSKRGKRIGHLLTLIAKRWDSDLKVEFDYSGVEALNSMRTDQIQRATSHILNGFPTGEAYAYEGLEDAPIINAADREPEADDIGDEEEESARAFFLKILEEEETEDFAEIMPSDHPMASAEKTKESVGDKDPPNFSEDIEQRRQTWDMWLKSRQQPAEKMLEKSTVRYLKGASERYQKRVKKYLTVKANQPVHILDLDELIALTEERQEIYNTIGGTWQKVWALAGAAELDNAFRLARQTKPLDVTFSSRDLLLDNINKMTQEISRTTADTIENIVGKGLEEGLTITDIAERVKESRGFAIGRATTIARTESTKAVNRAAVAAYAEAEKYGITVYKEWIASRDGKTRESHVRLDGTTIPVNDLFDTGTAKGMGPADFGVASEDINCRCAIVPVVKK